MAASLIRTSLKTELILPVRNSYVNGERYRSVISNFLWSKLDDMDTDELWFQQDGATYHTVHTTIEILRERFEGRPI